MILRNVVTRHGRKALVAPAQKFSARFLTTETIRQQPGSFEPSISNPTQQNASSPPVQPIVSQLSLASKLARPSKGPSNTRMRKNERLARHIRDRTGKVGADIEPYYEPHHVLVDPPKPEDITLELLMASQAHMGHATSLWNPMNQRYIYGIREGIHIISLETIAAHLRRAAKVVEGVAYHGGLILFVGTRKGQSTAIVKAAEMAQGCHLFERWIPGTITNKDTILADCQVKAVDKDDLPVEGYEEKVEEWSALKPDLVVCLNPLENYVMLHECGNNGIPTIGIIDTDADPLWVTYPIPANDDSLRCTQLIAGILGRAAQSGQEKRLAAAANGEITWKPPPGLGQPFEDDEEKWKEMEKERLARLNEQRLMESAGISLDWGNGPIPRRSSERQEENDDL